MKIPPRSCKGQITVVVLLLFGACGAHAQDTGPRFRAAVFGGFATPFEIPTQDVGGGWGGGVELEARLVWRLSFVAAGAYYPRGTAPCAEPGCHNVRNEKSSTAMAKVALGVRPKLNGPLAVLLMAGPARVRVKYFYGEFRPEGRPVTYATHQAIAFGGLATYTLNPRVVLQFGIEDFQINWKRSDMPRGYIFPSSPTSSDSRGRADAGLLRIGGGVVF